MGKNKIKNSGGTAAKTTTNKKAAAAFVVALVVVLAYVIAALTFGLGSGVPVWNPFKWGKARGTADGGSNIPAQTIAISADGSEIKDGGKYSIGRSAVAGIAYLNETSDYQTYVPEGEIIVSAELSNEYIRGAFDWSVKFANPEAEWAVGKVADYYVSAEAVAGNSSTAKLRYLAPFGEQIILTATLRGSDSSDSCTIDCVKAVTLSNWSSTMCTGENYSNIEANITYGVGTVAGDFISCSAAIDFTDSFMYDFQNYLKFTATINWVQLGSTDNITADNYYGIYCVTAEYDGLTYSKLIRNFDSYDTAHKEAICYAWAHAVKDSRYDSNFYLTATFSYGYNGVVISNSECDYQMLPQNSGGCITGEICDDGNNALDLAPNVQLNKNYVF